MLIPPHSFPTLNQVTELINDEKNYSVSQPRTSILDPQAEPRMGQSQYKLTEFQGGTGHGLLESVPDPIGRETP